MKIATLVNEFPPQKIGGVGISAYNTAKCLSKRGHEVHVVTVLDEKTLISDFDKELHMHLIYCKKTKFIGMLLFYIRILGELKNINPDLVHVQGLWVGIPAYFAKKIYKIPYVVSGHGSDIYLQSKVLMYLRSKPILKNANAVIALTAHMKKEMQKICDRNVLVIPNGIDLEKYNNLPIKSNNSNNNNAKIIIFVGTLVPVKGVKYLVEAMGIIINNSSNVKLILVGDGSDRNKLENYVKELNLDDYISIIGKVPNSEIPQYMASSDVFVLPSLSEGFGIVLLEAMAAGLPIVASNVGGIPSLIQNEVNGFLVEPKSPSEIAEKVLLLLENNVLSNCISQNNIEFIKKYDLENIASQIENIYYDCILTHN